MMMNVRRLLATAERAARQAASSTAGAASEAAAARRGYCSASGRSDEVAASRGGRMFLNALLGGSALSLLYTYQSAVSSAILEESKLMSLAEELIEPGAHMAGGAGGMHREKLLARRGQAKTPDGFYNPAGLPKFYEAFAELSDADSDILIIRLRLLAFMPNNAALKLEKEEIMTILKRRGMDLRSLASI